MKKRILKIFLVFIFTCIFTFALSGVYAADYDIIKYDIDALIKKDGTIHIEERLIYDFYEDMNGVYRDIMYNYEFDEQKDDMGPTSSRYQAISIKNIRAYASNVSFDSMIEATEKNLFLTNGMDGYFSF